MCLGHVYIVLEPVGSARLTFDDDLYYELCILMTEVCLEYRMRSGTSEESLNSQDVKIDISDDHIRTSERFRVIRVFFGVPRSYENSPGEVIGLTGSYGKGGGRPRGGGARPPWVLIGLGEGGGAPLALSYSLSLSLFPSLLLRKGKGFLLGLGSPSRTPYSWHAPRGAASPLPPLYTWAGDTPKEQQTIS